MRWCPNGELRSCAHASIRPSVKSRIEQLSLPTDESNYLGVSAVIVPTLRLSRLSGNVCYCLCPGGFNVSVGVSHRAAPPEVDVLQPELGGVCEEKGPRLREVRPLLAVRAHCAASRGPLDGGGTHGTLGPHRMDVTPVVPTRHKSIHY
eukprot:scaffold8349_cov32-Prasinocladus_malaysianus.AAC.2